MGRSLTDEEMREYQKQRESSLKKISAGLGISSEELEKIEVEAIQDIESEASKSRTNKRKEIAVNAVKKALGLAEKAEKEGTTYDYQPGDLGPDILEELKAQEFAELLAILLTTLKGKNRESAVDTTMTIINRGDDNSRLALRHEIYLTLDSMIRSQKWQEEHEGGEK